MAECFNLLEEPWMPVRGCNGQVRDVGLLALFDEAHDISALADTEPPALMAEYRLLLAITHRALVAGDGRWKDADRVRWHQQGLPRAAIRDYLMHWREHFWLFHPTRPFMQVAALSQAPETRDKLKPWMQIALASANGNTPVVFDHAYDPAPVGITPGQAVRSLLGFLQFTPGGLVKTIRDADKAGALANTAAVLPIGLTLDQTLCLALHPAPMAGHEDLPSWERTPPSPADLRADPSPATGPNDRYTRLSRAVLLQPEDDGQVRWLRFSAGVALADDEHAPDPMASYRAGSNHLVRLSFDGGRAFWRDLPALVPDAAGKASHPAAVLGWAANLHAERTWDRVEQPLLVAGLASEQAKLLRWRSEQIALPAVLLSDADKAAHLRQLVGESESFFSELRSLAARMLAQTLPDPGSKDTRARARSLFDTGPATALYFARAERALAAAMALIGAERTDEAEVLWHQALRAAADAAWTAVRTGMGASASALRAEARHGLLYGALLRRLTTETAMAPQAEEA